MKALILVCLSALVAGCSLIPPTYSCPIDNAYDYLACAKPSFPRQHGEAEDEFVEGLVKLIDSYCEDDASEWIPVLEKGVRATLPDVKEFLETGPTLRDWLPYQFTLEEQALETLDNDELYRSVLAMVLFAPVNAGMMNYIYLGRRPGSCLNPSDCKPLRTGNCVRVFEFITSKRLIEFMKE